MCSCPLRSSFPSSEPRQSKMAPSWTHQQSLPYRSAFQHCAGGAQSLQICIITCITPCLIALHNPNIVLAWCPHSLTVLPKKQSRHISSKLISIGILLALQPASQHTICVIFWPETGVPESTVQTRICAHPWHRGLQQPFIFGTEGCNSLSSLGQRATIAFCVAQRNHDCPGVTPNQRTQAHHTHQCFFWFAWVFGLGVSLRV